MSESSDHVSFERVVTTVTNTPPIATTLFCHLPQTKIVQRFPSVQFFVSRHLDGFYHPKKKKGKYREWRRGFLPPKQSSSLTPTVCNLHLRVLEVLIGPKLQVEREQHVQGLDQISVCWNVGDRTDHSHVLVNVKINIGWRQ